MADDDTATLPTATPTDHPARERLTRWLHALMGPRGEDTDRAWDTATEASRDTYRAIADSLIEVVQREGRPAVAAPYTSADVEHVADLIADARMSGMATGGYSMARAILEAGYRRLPATKVNP